MEQEEQQQKPENKMTYSELSGFEFNQVLMKLSNTPTTTARASAIRQVVKSVQKLKDKISAEYMEEVVKPNFQVGDDGKPKVDDQGQYIPLEGREEEVKKANEDFGKREVVIELQFRPSMLVDVKGITATEMERLKNLYNEEDGPGLPQMPFPGGPGQNVTQLRQ